MKNTWYRYNELQCTLVLTGLLYPFAMTGLAQVLFPWRANGSLVTDEKGSSRRLGIDCDRDLPIQPIFSQGRRRPERRATTRRLRRAPTSVRRRRSCRTV